MVSSLRLDVDARRRKVDEILATVRGSAMVLCFLMGFFLAKVDGSGLRLELRIPSWFIGNYGKFFFGKMD